MVSRITCICFFVFVFAACSNTGGTFGGGPSQDIKEKAVALATSYMTGGNIGIKNQRIVQQKQLPLTNSNKANAVTERWCFTIDYIVNFAGEWQDRNVDAILVYRQNGKLDGWSHSGECGHQ